MMEEIDNSIEKEPLVQPLTGSKTTPVLKEIVLPAVAIIGIILAGTMTGYLLARPGGLSLMGGGGKAGLFSGGGLTPAQTEMGIKDEKKFPDKAEGKIKVNDNPDVPDGSHQLLRPGGLSQTAYLTSSVVDLNLFIDRCVQIMGQTFSSQKAGWFMDVGWIRVLNQCPEGL